MIHIPENSMLIVNLLIVVLYLVMIIRGGRQGVLRQILSLAGLLLALFCAWRYAPVFASYLKIVPTEWLPLQDTMLAEMVQEQANKLVWYLIVFLVVRLLISLISHVAGLLHRIPVLHQISALLGAAVGAISATFWVLLACVLLSSSIFSNGSYVIRNSWLSVIQEKANVIMVRTGMPVTADEFINQIYEASQNLSSEDQEAVASWLEEQGLQESSLKGEMSLPS